MSDSAGLPAARPDLLAPAAGGRPRTTLHRRLHVGVFSSVRPIEGVATAVAAFVGLAAEGPFNKPILVTSWAQYKQNFGEVLKGAYLPRAVQAFLNNGGRACYVVRIGLDWAPDRPAPRVALGTGSDSGGAGSSAASADPAADPAGVDATFGRPVFQAALAALEAIDEITMVSAPDVMMGLQNGWIDLVGLAAVQIALIQHCELMGDRIAILDSPPGLSIGQVREWRQVVAGYDSKFAALYWPWLKTLDLASGKQNFMPPCGHVAGAWSRNDAERGVHVAPTNELVNGAIDVEVNTPSEEQPRLTAAGINVIRSLPGKGIRISSASTLSTDGLWQNINVRRLVNYLEKSILNGTDWVASQPKDERLWANIEQTVAGFLAMESRRGVLSGARSPDCFFVRCDSETNADGADTGDVVCEIGVAPVKTTEFVVFRLSHHSGGFSEVTEDDDTL